MKRWVLSVGFAAVLWALAPCSLVPPMAQAHEKEGQIHEVPSEYRGKNNPYWTNLHAILEGGLIYEEKCAFCHGNTGQGDGPIASILDPRPTKFTDSQMMAEMNDGYLLWRVSEGGKSDPFNSAMPRWKGIMKEDDIWKVIAYAHAFSHGSTDLRLEHVHPPEAVRKDRETKSKGHISYKVPDDYKGKANPYWVDLRAILEGGLVYGDKCAVCHGRTGRGDGTLARFLDPKPKDFTDSRMMADVKADYLFWRVSEGGKFWPFESVMPRWKGVLSDDDIWKVISYVHAFSHGEDLKIEHTHRAAGRGHLRHD